MDNAIYITLSRQMGLARQMDVVANNIANTNTPGFKSEAMLFESFLVDQKRYSHSEPTLHFTNDRATIRDLKPGPLRLTKRPFDVAIQGEGYFMVETPAGARYTRAGNFATQFDGTLINAQGYPVLGPDGQRIVIAPEQREINVQEDGVVNANGEQIGQIAVMTFPNEQLMEKLGNGLYQSAVPPIPADNVRVIQGALEDSNVSSIHELTKLIETQRGISTTANHINTLDELERTAVRTIAKQGGQ